MRCGGDGPAGHDLRFATADRLQVAHVHAGQDGHGNQQRRPAFLCQRLACRAQHAFAPQRMHIQHPYAQTCSRMASPGDGGGDVVKLQVQEDLETLLGKCADELRAGVTWLGPGSSERFIPQMLGFDELDAVSFSKGCYPGQEIVARARYLGSVKRKPLVLEVNGAVEPEPGAKLRVQRGEEWHDAVVVDSAPAGAGRTVVFTVARAEPDLPAQALEFGGETYGCATI